MSAMINALPASASPVAQLAKSATNADSAISEPAGDTSSLGSFAALFEQLMGQQQGNGKNLDQILLAASPDQKETATDAQEDLNALLPFLDAMGLLQPTPPENAVAVGNPAISAAVQAAEVPGAAAVPTSTTEAVVSNADSTAAEGIMPAVAGNQHEAKELSDGREFSTQLVNAIAANKEAAEAPGNTATVVHQVIAAASPRNSHAATPTQHVAEPVGSARWSEEVGNRIVWMANRLESKAELVLTPPQMGRVEVSLSISGDQATANFVSGNAAVREALEAALPRLREALADAGIQLGQAQVGAENARQSAQQEKNGDNFAFNRGAAVDNSGSQGSSGAMSTSAGLKTGRGLVDIFA